MVASTILLGQLLDPYDSAVKAFALCLRVGAADAAFAVASGRGGQATLLTHIMFAVTLRQCLHEVGADHSMYSGHSVRRGGATFAHRLGVGPLLIKRMDDW